MSKYLLDTHVLLWWAHNDSRLSDVALSILKDEENQILISAVSAWEIAIKYALKKLQLPLAPREFLQRVMSEYQFVPLAISFLHATHVAELPPVHTDPFDRLLIAQAREEKIPLLSDDPQIAKYELDLVW
jgi:PIN domain nuclease of toxin-antitoxin system